MKLNRRRRATGWLAAAAAALVAVTGLVATGPTASAAPVDTSAWYVLVSRHSGLALDVEGNSRADGAALIQWSRTDAANQQFRFVDSGDGMYRLQARHSGKVLEVDGGSGADGADIVQRTDGNAAHQQWRMVDVDGGTYVTLVNRQSGKAMDVWEWSTTAGGRVAQYTETNGVNQQWRLIEVDGDGQPPDQGCDATAPGPLSGDLGAHDPALVVGCGDDPWYAFATGDGRINDGTIPIRRSTDGRNWTSAGTVWNSKPNWVVQAIPGVDNLWAPDIHYDAGSGRYYMYYSASTFGSQRSLIGLATNATLDPNDPGYNWVDEGLVFESFPGNPYNAIDPGIIVDGGGTHWMTFGSWWSGIYIVQLDWPSGKPAAGAQPIHLADRSPAGTSAIEAPYIIERGGYYYLFVSLDRCCAGTDSTYKIAVGRSGSVTGPYVAENGTPMLNGGATVLLAGHNGAVAAGGQSLSHGFIGYHSYLTNGAFRLGIEQVQWTGAGWPRLSGS